MNAHFALKRSLNPVLFFTTSTLDAYLALKRSRWLVTMPSMLAALLSTEPAAGAAAEAALVGSLDLVGSVGFGARKLCL